MQGSRIFNNLVSAGNPVGEIIGIDSFMVSVRGLQPTNVHATVRFDDDTRGYVHQVTTSRNSLITSKKTML
ncbi:MAG: hypothetical protein EOO17_04200 [Chloroflexi bacterium]|nr:MAG: hypothetical protein EOO17_04200 [Chloroflexota bacterium]